MQILSCVVDRVREGVEEMGRASEETLLPQ